jgi:hypothetical protein
MARTIKRKRTSCGFCLTNSDHRHQSCPGTLPTAMAGKPWTCWCAEQGHPDVIPPAPQFDVQVDDEVDAPAEPSDEPRTPEPKKEGARKARDPKALTPRCGAPTKRGPCKRKEGHTAGHDGR